MHMFNIFIHTPQLGHSNIAREAKAGILVFSVWEGKSFFSFSVFQPALQSLALNLSSLAVINIEPVFHLFRLTSDISFLLE